ncbi:MAG: M23 family metallopeptidase [Pseudomonadota bacterium]
MTRNIRNRHYALIGISAEQLPGSYILRVSPPDLDSFSQTFRVSPLLAEDAQRSRTLDTSLADSDLDINESSFSIDYNADFDTQSYQPDFRFETPVEPKLLVPFGILISDKPTSEPIRHFGLTYFSKQDALVYAPATGRVSHIEQNANGTWRVYLHHGLSLQSAIDQLSEIVVDLDQEIAQGELIGVVSDSQLGGFGRVDWGVLLNGALIDPLALVPEN